MNENGILQEKIENVIDLNFDYIKINVVGRIVTIEGTVNSSDEINEIHHMIWNTSGVEFINNELNIAHRF